MRAKKIAPMFSLRMILLFVLIFVIVIFFGLYLAGRGMTKMNGLASLILMVFISLVASG